ncbi:hypothetical protein K503DRAFT_595090 [Rhizopogon vinicolor AM-OR11-026]|uniref:Uncharacterized protein n=1 Tax=Rhizopogon vinicolor AM-OR11-026 TaxID=1314800 RepID=A0A1B7N728_9AGAM|nr:hypothetical protein K503DRAFT_595090 [Rhizopogon vinicolor AM-OR11-026]
MCISPCSSPVSILYFIRTAIRRIRMRSLSCSGAACMCRARLVTILVRSLISSWIAWSVLIRGTITGDQSYQCNPYDIILYFLLEIWGGRSTHPQSGVR